MQIGLVCYGVNLMQHNQDTPEKYLPLLWLDDGLMTTNKINTSTITLMLK